MYDDLMDKFIDLAMPESLKFMEDSVEIFHSISYSDFEDDMARMEDSDSIELMVPVRDVLLLLNHHLLRVSDKFGIEFAPDATMDYIISRLTYLLDLDLDSDINDEDPTLVYTTEMATSFGTEPSYEYRRTLDLERFHELLMETMEKMGEVNMIKVSQIVTFTKVSKHDIISQLRGISKMEDMSLSSFAITLNDNSLKGLSLEHKAESLFLAALISGEYDEETRGEDIMSWFRLSESDTIVLPFAIDEFILKFRGS